MLSTPSKYTVLKDQPIQPSPNGHSISTTYASNSKSLPFPPTLQDVFIPITDTTTSTTAHTHFACLNPHSNPFITASELRETRLQSESWRGYSAKALPAFSEEDAIEDENANNTIIPPLSPTQCQSQSQIYQSLSHVFGEVCSKPRYAGSTTADYEFSMLTPAVTHTSTSIQASPTQTSTAINKTDTRIARKTIFKQQQPPKQDAKEQKKQKNANEVNGAKKDNLRGYIKKMVTIAKPGGDKNAKEDNEHELATTSTTERDFKIPSSRALPTKTTPTTSTPIIMVTTSTTSGIGGGKAGEGEANEADATNAGDDKSFAQKKMKMFKDGWKFASRELCAPFKQYQQYYREHKGAKGYFRFD